MAVQPLIQKSSILKFGLAVPKTELGGLGFAPPEPSNVSISIFAQSNCTFIGALVSTVKLVVYVWAPARNPLTVIVIPSFTCALNQADVKVNTDDDSIVAVGE